MRRTRDTFGFSTIVAKILSFLTFFNRFFLYIYIYLVHLNFCTVEEVRKVEDINLIKLLSNLSSVRGQKFSLERSS